LIGIEAPFSRRSFTVIAEVPKDYPDGTIFWLYLILAGFMRFLVEFWRANAVVGVSMTEYQWISIVLVGLGLTLILRPRQQIAG
jgi:prolipoprotein diacylglyceryltransferase